MALEWLRRENDLKDHQLIDNSHFGGDAPTVIYEERPVLDDKGAAVAGLYSAWIWLNNPTQYNSYTTDMVKGVIAGMQRASSDRKIVAVVFTAVGDKAFCTGGNTAEYAVLLLKAPNEYGEYMDLFNAMVDGILNCKKPVICRVNGMRVAGGQEIGMATDITVAPTSPSSARPAPSTARRRSAARPTSCPGSSPWKMRCTTASPARPGAPTR
jgi:6-oxo-cyclohex-1-ene-carbonyl-CoA hydrolase